MAYPVSLICFKLLIVICTCLLVKAQFPIELSQIYLKKNNIGQENYFLCESTADGTDLIKDIMFNRKERISFKRIKILRQDESTESLKHFSHQGRLGIVLDLTCDAGMLFLKKSSESYYFNGNYVWLIWSESYDEAIQILNETNLSVNSNAALITPGYYVYDLYKITYSWHIISNRIASWTPENGYLVEMNKTVRNNLQGLSIPISAVTLDLEVNENSTLEDLSDPLFKPEYGAVSRENFNFISFIAKMLNVSFILKPSKSWGYSLTPGNFSGCLGAIILNEAEVCISTMNMREDRYQYVDFLYTIRLSQAMFSFLQPSSFGSVTSLTEPLSGEVWAFFGLLTVLFILTYRIISKYNSSSDINSWGAIIIYSIGAVAQQGFEDTVTSASGRVLNITLLLMSFIVFTYYNASVLNSLLSPSLHTILTTQQLLDSGMELGLLDLPYSKDRSAESIFGVEDAQRDQFYLKLDQTPKLFYEINEGLEKIRQGRFALYSLTESFYPRIMSTYSDAQICSFYHVTRMPAFPLAMTIRSESPYADLLKESLFSVSERGLVDRSLKEWYTSKPTCHWRQEATSIGPKSLSVAYIVLVSGIIMSLIIITIELIKHNFFSKSNKSFKLNNWFNKSKVNVRKMSVETIAYPQYPISKEFIN